MTTKREWGFVSVFFLMMALTQSFSGCVGTASAEKINEAVLRTRRHDYTTEKCLRLARKSRQTDSQEQRDYRLGGGDVLNITIYGLERRGEFKTVTVRVEESGVFSLPVIPPINAKGLTVSELESQLNKVMIEMDFIKNPRTSVIVTDFKSKKISVLGAVNRPGEYTIERNSVSLYEALALAGGPSHEAGYVLHVMRGDQDDGHPFADSRGGEARASGPSLPKDDGLEETISVDLISLMKEANLDLNLLLYENDIVYIPEAEYFYVIGFVNAPGGFPLTRPMRVLDGIATASGLIAKEASPGDCVLKRLEGDKEFIVPIDLVAIVEGREPNLYLKPDDIIDVRQTQLRFFVLEAWDWFKRIFVFSYQLNPKAYETTR